MHTLLAETILDVADHCIKCQAEHKKKMRDYIILDIKRKKSVQWQIYFVWLNARRAHNKNDVYTISEDFCCYISLHSATDYGYAYLYSIYTLYMYSLCYSAPCRFYFKS